MSSAARTLASLSVRQVTGVGAMLTITLGQVGKVLGERWKALNEKQRGPYENKAKADKERYDSEKAAYSVCSPLERDVPALTSRATPPRTRTRSSKLLASLRFRRLQLVALELAVCGWTICSVAFGSRDYAGCGRRAFTDL